MKKNTTFSKIWFQLHEQSNFPNWQHLEAIDAYNHELEETNIIPYSTLTQLYSYRIYFSGSVTFKKDSHFLLWDLESVENYGQLSIWRLVELKIL